MKHSKLPWKKQSLSNGFRGIVDVNNKTVLAISWHAPKCDEDITFIVKACSEHDTLKAKAELLDEIMAVSEGSPRCCRYLRDGFGVMACSGCLQKTFSTLLSIQEILKKAEALK